MKKNISTTIILRLLFVLTIFQFVITFSTHSQSEEKKRIAIVIHGGAGTILKNNMTQEKEDAYKSKLKEALQTGYDILIKGGSSLDAVESAIKILEDSPLFNAGKGAVFTNEGKNELDASIMDGKTLNAGAVAAVTVIKNPISAARQVMENSPHVLLCYAGAEKFAKEQGLEMVKPSYFFTKKRYKHYKENKKKTKNKRGKKKEIQQGKRINISSNKSGTVGAVALDQFGNLAAGTSTGGMSNKRFGRIGDSPIIGAGTYANNKTCAVSATGHGEYFIRSVVAYDISALMEYKGYSLEKAANKVIMKKLVELGGSGGIIAVDKDGNIAMPFNTAGMFRGYVIGDGKPFVLIYKEE